MRPFDSLCLLWAGEFEDAVLVAVEMDAASFGHAEPPRDPLGVHVDGPDQRDHVVVAPLVECRIANSRTRFCGVAAAPVDAIEEPADLGMALAFDVLEGEPDLSDGIPGFAFDREPQALAIAPIAFELTLEPRLRLGTAEPALIELIHLGMRHHQRDEVDVAPGHLTQQQSWRFENDPAHRPTLACRLHGFSEPLKAGVDLRG